MSHCDDPVPVLVAKHDGQADTAALDISDECRSYVARGGIEGAKNIPGHGVVCMFLNEATNT